MYIYIYIYIYTHIHMYIDDVELGAVLLDAVGAVAAAEAHLEDIQSYFRVI